VGALRAAGPALRAGDRQAGGLGGELPVLALRARFLSVGEAGFLDEHGPDALIGLLMGAHADLTRLGRVALL
jgi:hypothetical protein